MKKKILMIGTGGTIACKQTEEGLLPAQSSEELLSAVPGAGELCDAEFCQLFNLDSTNIGRIHWIAIAKKIQEEYDRYDGFLITHGTDTMAYTASALSYLIQDADKPIVITGSQRPMGEFVTDAGKNLQDSLRFVCAGIAGGVYIVFDGKALIGTRARKVRTKSTAAFESINYPTFAFIDGNRIFPYLGKPRRAKTPKFYDALSDRVCLIKLFPGIRPDIFDYAAEHYDAIVIESYGVGGIPQDAEDSYLAKIERLTSMNKTVVIASQVMLEGSDADVYEVGYRSIHNYHALQSYDMTIEAAITKLMWILAQTGDAEKIRRLFLTPVSHDISHWVDMS